MNDVEIKSFPQQKIWNYYRNYLPNHWLFIVASRGAIYIL
jgi:hypothetical protein